jgi:hypothetical protein
MVRTRRDPVPPGALGTSSKKDTSRRIAKVCSGEGTHPPRGGSGFGDPQRVPLHPQPRPNPLHPPLYVSPPGGAACTTPWGRVPMCYHPAPQACPGLFFCSLVLGRFLEGKCVCAGLVASQPRGFLGVGNASHGTHSYITLVSTCPWSALCRSLGMGVRRGCSRGQPPCKTAAHFCQPPREPPPSNVFICPRPRPSFLAASVARMAVLNVRRSLPVGLAWLSVAASQPPHSRAFVGQGGLSDVVPFLCVSSPSHLFVVCLLALRWLLSFFLSFSQTIFEYRILCVCVCSRPGMHPPPPLWSVCPHRPGEVP